MYIAYTHCETGFRSFAHISGVSVSYDRRFIDYLIKERSQAQDTAKRIIADMDQKVHATLPEIPDMLRAAMEHNQSVLTSQQAYIKRLATAEVAIGDLLVRDVHYFDSIHDAIAYSQGQP